MCFTWTILIFPLTWKWDFSPSVLHKPRIGKHVSTYLLLYRLFLCVYVCTWAHMPSEFDVSYGTLGLGIEFWSYAISLCTPNSWSISPTPYFCLTSSYYVYLRYLILLRILFIAEAGIFWSLNNYFGISEWQGSFLEWDYYAVQSI